MNVDRPLKILIASVQVPFTRGGAEILADRLRAELRQRGHVVDLVQLPFGAQPKTEILSQMAQWRALRLDSVNGADVDLVVATKFPSYFIAHRNKVVWLVHQHRQIYDLYDSRFGDFTTEPEDEALRRLIVKGDIAALSESRAIFTISPNVTERLKRYLDLSSEVLLPPLPMGSRYRRGGNGGYILSVGRLCSIKRVDLMIKALPLIDSTVKLKVVGLPDEPGIQDYLQSEIDKHHLWSRVEFLGRVSEEELIRLFAEAFAVYYARLNRRGRMSGVCTTASVVHEGGYSLNAVPRLQFRSIWNRNLRRYWQKHGTGFQYGALTLLLPCAELLRSTPTLLFGSRAERLQVLKNLRELFMPLERSK